jgi:hypothetical protein
MKDHPVGTHPSAYAMGGIPSTSPQYCKIFEMTDMAPLGGF